ncbi:MAG: ECF transporter S component [Clostridia bacterium]|nr:ECF transporter S component [Clostridia bacterium]
MQNSKLKTMVKIAMLAAVAEILFLFKVPLPFIAPPFYELDFSGVASLIGSFALGPLAGVLIELIKNLLNLLIDGSITGGVGELSNFFTGCAYVLPASIIYKIYKTRKSALIGILGGIVFMTVFSYYSNVYVMIPAYAKALEIPIDLIVSMGSEIHPSIDTVSALALMCVVPFNFIKGTLVGAVTFVLYKKIRRIL